MKTLKILIVIITVAVVSSCNFDLRLGQKNGNGNVTSEDRPVTENFTKIKASSGLDVILLEGDSQKVIVEADENLQEIIETYIENGTLYLSTSENIGRSKSKTVHVIYKNLESISASSGADVTTNSILKSESLTLDCSSGADLEVEVFAKEVFAETSSGADLKVWGKATSLNAKASSGSDLNAKNLLVINCKADASSGADITVNVKERLESEATSGGDIEYYGNPEAVTESDSVSGSVRKM